MSRPDAQPLHSFCQIGLFDSGVGGLSVARELLCLSPPHPIIYLADQAHAPYGERSLAEIRGFTDGITRFLLDQGAEVIVVACNTASAAALHWLREQYPAVPFVGMEPAVKPAAERTRSGHIGVIATAATFQGELFASLLDRFAGRAVIHTQVCPELVPLVEAGDLDSPHARELLEDYLAPLLAAGIDQLVLGCTHYPFLRSLIDQIVGSRVEVIDPAPAVARQTARLLAQPVGARHSQASSAQQDTTNSTRRLPKGRSRVGMPRPYSHRFYTTGDPDRFRIAVIALLGLTLKMQPMAGEGSAFVVEAATWDAAHRLRPVSR